MVKASANHSYNRTRGLAELIGSKPARTWRVGTAWATPHRATAPAAMCIIRAKTNSGSGPIRTPFRFIPNKLPAESERGQ